jgi:hypothetical protein
MVQVLTDGVATDYRGTNLTNVHESAVSWPLVRSQAEQKLRSWRSYSRIERMSETVA